MLGGIVSGIGSIVGGVLGYKGQKDTNKANIAMSDKQMAFQADQADLARDYMREMSGTAYQRAMADMKEAGLNPILAYSQGGASTPSSPAMSGSMPVLQNPYAAGANVGTQVANSASNIASAQSQRDKISQEIDNLTAQYELTWSQRQQVINATRKLDEEIRQVRAQTEGIQHENVPKEVWANYVQSQDFIELVRKLGIGVMATAGIIGGAAGLSRGVIDMTKKFLKGRRNKKDIRVDDKDYDWRP